MKTKFDWRTSRAAFSTFKKLLFLVKSKENTIDEPWNKMADMIKHEDLISFTGLNRSILSEHLQGFVDSGFVSVVFSGRQKFYDVNTNKLYSLIKKSASIETVLMIADSFEDMIRFSKSLK